MQETPVCLGYKAIRPVPRPLVLQSRFIPETILSASGHICPIGPWSSFDEPDLDEFGIDVAMSGEYVAWARAEESSRRLLAYGVVTELATVRDFVNRFCTPLADVVVIGLAVSSSIAQELIRFLSEPEHGLSVMATERRALASGGTPIGYEILGFGDGAIHSWTCNLLQDEVLPGGPAEVNAQGLVDDLSQAVMLAESINRDGRVAETCADHWFPVRLVKYPAT